MDKIIATVKETVKGWIEVVKGWLEKAMDWLRDFYNETLLQIPFLQKFDGLLGLELKWWLLIALGAVVFLILLISIIVGIAKKKKVKFYVNGKKIAVKKVKFKKEIPFPDAPSVEGKAFIGWFKDKKLTKKFDGVILNKNKKLKLYAGFEDVIVDNQFEVDGQYDVENQYEVENEVEPIENEIEVENVEPIANNEEVEYQEVSAQEELSYICEEVINVDEAVSELAYYYDEIRYTMLCYERATAFKELGMVRKQVIAKMFQKDDQINLYLSLDPQAMRVKGYAVEDYDSIDFASVPTKKVVRDREDFEEALCLIKEAMTLNNLVPSEIVTATKAQSDENVRRSGFVFYLKNESVVTSAVDYYKYLRTSVNSYALAPNKQYPIGCENKMILKIFKKDERVVVYLALNAEKEGLEFVGYDKNFADTPAMIRINTAEDLIKANVLIDKLMSSYGLERYPDKAEVIESEIQENCGFGYRIRR